MSASRYTLSQELKTKAPLIAALDLHEDATGPFAAFLEKQGLLKVYGRYGETVKYPLSFYYDAERIAWGAVELDFLNQTGQMAKAKRYAAGNVPRKFFFGSLIFELLKFTPIALLIWWAAHR